MTKHKYVSQLKTINNGWKSKLKFMIINTIKQYKLFHVPKKTEIEIPSLSSHHHNIIKKILHIQHQAGKRLNFNKKTTTTKLKRGN